MEGLSGLDGWIGTVGTGGGSCNHSIAGVVGECGCRAVPCCAGQAVLGIVGVGGAGEFCLVSIGIEGDRFASDGVGISGGSSLFESFGSKEIH